MENKYTVGDTRYDVVKLGLWATDYVFGVPAIMNEERIDVLQSLQAIENPHPYVPYTAEQLEEALAFLSREPQQIERRIVMHTGPEGVRQFQQALQEEASRQGYELPDSVSITRQLPASQVLGMSQDELINYLDQISREDV